jgi:citronellol/citronellal dehydrogenase
MSSYQSVFAPGLFKDQVIVITGGGTGIGRCTAHELASLGATVVLMGRREEKLQEVVAEIEADSKESGSQGKADYRVADIRDEERVIEAIADIVSQHGRIHALVNNAGGQFPSKVEDISKNGFQTVVENNLVGGFVMAREVYKATMKEHGGNVVNITADCNNGFPGMAHTGAARAGMENFTKTAAWEWGRYGVRVNAVAPGIVASSGLTTYDPMTRKKLLMAGEMMPARRLCTEAEVSASIVFLLTPAAAFINGETLHVDGGAQFGSSHMYMPLPRPEENNVELYDGFHRSNLDELLAE